MSRELARIWGWGGRGGYLGSASPNQHTGDFLSSGCPCEGPGGWGLGSGPHHLPSLWFVQPVCLPAPGLSSLLPCPSLGMPFPNPGSQLPDTVNILKKTTSKPKTK